MTMFAVTVELKRSPFMNTVRISLLAAAVSLAACGGGGNEAVDAHGNKQAFEKAPNIAPPWLGAVSAKSYDGVADDLLTAGLGKTGLAGAAPVPTDAKDPAQLRKYAIYINYRAIVDINAGGGYGTLYGPNVTAGGTVTTGEGKIGGNEYIAYADLGQQRDNVTLMVQVPTTFDPANACIVTGTSSGSRGVYGAIGSSGEWGLKRGCAVAYADKGTGNGMHDLHNDTTNFMNGVRDAVAAVGSEASFVADIIDSQRIAFDAATPNRIAVKHAHSQRNPEKDWGRDTLRAVEFAFYVLNEQFGETLPSGKKARVITPAGTIVIASSVSNGAGAALAAAEEDKFGLIDGVAVTEPNIQIRPPVTPVIQRGSLIYTGGSKPLYDFFSFANIYQPCASLAPSLPTTGLPLNTLNAANAANRCTTLAELGLVSGSTTAERATDAMNRLFAYGWEPETAVLQPSHYTLATASIVMTYANAHGRFSVLDNLCGLSFAYTDAAGKVAPVAASLATIFSVGNGVPPTGGINIVNNNAFGGPTLDAISGSTAPGRVGRTDYGSDAALCQRELWTGSSLEAQRLQAGVTEVQKSANLKGKPALVVHGRNDTLVPVNFSSRPYYAENQRVEGASSGLRYIEVTNAQHFDAFLGFAGYSNRYVPLHVYFNRALDAMYAHLKSGTPLPPSQVVRTTPRGDGAPPIAAANVPSISANPPAADRITYGNNLLTIPQ
jgi:hydroxybutyrate-dimer hydrolase